MLTMLSMKWRKHNMGEIVFIYFLFSFGIIIAAAAEVLK